MYYPYYYGYYDPMYLGIALASLIVIFAAQALVKSRYSKYSKVANIRGITGADAARTVLESNGVYGVRIEEVAGNLTDHYDPRNNTIRLSSDVFHGKSIAAVGIASHEAGHAVQYAKKYVPVKLRTAIIPLARFGPMFGVILIAIGLMLNSMNLALAGVILYGAVFAFQFITLPVEFNASRRALVAIKETNLLYGEEYDGAKKTLTAAALTYVAAMLQSLLTLLYYIFRIFGNRRK